MRAILRQCRGAANPDVLAAVAGQLKGFQLPLGQYVCIHAYMLAWLGRFRSCIRLLAGPVAPEFDLGAQPDQGLLVAGIFVFVEIAKKLFNGDHDYAVASLASGFKARDKSSERSATVGLKSLGSTPRKK